MVGWGGTTRSKTRRDEDYLMSSPDASSVEEPETAVSQQRSEPGVTHLLLGV